jgi:hypothetical protein
MKLSLLYKNGYFFLNTVLSKCVVLIFIAVVGSYTFIHFITYIEFLPDRKACVLWIKVNQLQFLLTSVNSKSVRGRLTQEKKSEEGSLIGPSYSRRHCSGSVRIISVFHSSSVLILFLGDGTMQK